MENSVSVKKYILIFGIVYLLFLIIVNILSFIWHIDLGRVGSIMLITATMVASSKFITDNDRVPNKSEKYKLIWASLFVAVLMEIILVLVLAGISNDLELSQLTNIFSKVNIFVFIGIVLFVFLLMFLILLFSYGFLANRIFNGLQKKKN